MNNTVSLTYRDRVRYTISNENYGSKIITEPKGWNDDNKEYARHSRYHGIVTKFSNSLTFVGDGADFINEVFELFGINAEIFLKREERHPTTDKWTKTYIGVLDLSEWQSDENGVKVKFNSSGLEAVLKSRESEKIQIEREDDLFGNSLTPLNTYQIEAPERMVFLYSEFEQDTTSKVKTTVPGQNGRFYTISVPFPMQVVSKSDELIHKPQPTNFEFIPNAGNLLFGINDRKKKQTYTIKGSVWINPVRINRINSREFIKIVLTVYSGGTDYNLKKNITLYTDPNPKSVLKRKAVFNKKIDLVLEKGDSVVFRIWTGADLGSSYWGYGSFVHKYEDPELFLSIEENSFYKKTSSKIVMAHELGERLTEIITGKKGVFESDYLGRKELGYFEDGKGSLKGYTCGHWIRGFEKYPQNDENKYKPFTTSFRDYMEDLMVTENLGLAIEKIGFSEKIVIKPLEEMYVDEVTIKLPKQVNSVKRKIAKKQYVSSIQIGCTKGWDNEEAMGLDEYNAQSTFITPIIRLKNEVKKLTKYIYGSYAFEFIRRKPKEDFPTNDHRNDKEIFVLDLKRYGMSFKHRLWQDDFDEEPKGVYSPKSAYNLRYTPLQMLLRHKRFLSSSLQKYLSKFVRFSSSEGNTNLETKINGKKYNEKEDIICRDFGIPKYLPEEIEFEHEIDFDIREQIEGETVINGKKIKNIYGLIEFTNEKGQIERGRFQKLKPNGKVKWSVLKAS